MELSELSHSPGHRRRLSSLFYRGKTRRLGIREELFLLTFPRGAGKFFLHIVEHSVTDRMKNLRLIQFVNGYLGQEFKEKFDDRERDGMWNAGVVHKHDRFN